MSEDSIDQDQELIAETEKVEEVPIDALIDASNDAEIEDTTRPTDTVEQGPTNKLISTFKSETEPTELEKSLPENTEENPQPTVLKVIEADLQAHNNYLMSLTNASKEVKTPDIKKFVDTEKLNELGDDYEHTQRDSLGEAKVTENGFLTGGRKYIFSTFTLPGKGKRLYVLATEAARILSFRDSFILFLKNKSLVKVVCTDEERKFLESNGFAISRIKSRSITVVSARSMFINYGARIILSGKRVEDDYWEGQTVEQGFTKEDFVFPPYQKPRGPKRKKAVTTLGKVTMIDPKVKLKLPTVSFVHPLPTLEDRKEYLVATSNGVQSQILPGQGITGSLDLAAVSSLPKYRNEGAHQPKHKNLLNSLSTSGNSSPQVSISSTNFLPVDSKLAGQRASNGLPYYSTSITQRISAEDSEKLSEIEYLHSTVELNHLITVGRNARNKQWKYYWQARSGTTIGLTKDGVDEFLKSRKDFVNEVQTEVTYNEYLNSDQVVSKKRKPNPNFLNHGTITGLKAPYIDKEVNEIQPPTSVAPYLQHAQQPQIEAPINSQIGMHSHSQVLQQQQLLQQQRKNYPYGR